MKKIKVSASKVKIMPDFFMPLHFLSWLMFGPANDNPHPSWIPDTGKADLKKKVDVLQTDETRTNASIGTLSNYGRKILRRLTSIV